MREIKIGVVGSDNSHVIVGSRAYLQGLELQRRRAEAGDKHCEEAAQQEPKRHSVDSRGFTRFCKARRSVRRRGLFHNQRSGKLLNLFRKQRGESIFVKMGWMPFETDNAFRID
jgi:hypothetical protein